MIDDVGAVLAVIGDFITFEQRVNREFYAAVQKQHKSQTAVMPEFTTGTGGPLYYS